MGKKFPTLKELQRWIIEIHYQDQKKQFFKSLSHDQQEGMYRASKILRNYVEPDLVHILVLDMPDCIEQEEKNHTLKWIALAKWMVHAPERHQQIVMLYLKAANPYLPDYYPKIAEDFLAAIIEFVDPMPFGTTKELADLTSRYHSIYGRTREKL